MYTISKEFHFSASHQLFGLEPDHPCGRLHGHNYVVIVTLESAYLGGEGFVQDYGALKPIQQFIDTYWDHRHLNEVLPIQPSAENMACYLYEWFKPMYPMLKSVSVKETPKTIATYHE